MDVDETSCYSKKNSWATKKLPMEIGKIVQEYTQAKNRNKQIDILAELNGTKSCRIAWILSRVLRPLGIDVDPKKMPRALRSGDSFDYVKFWEGSDDAKICDEISERMQKLEQEKEQAALRERQSMPEFDAMEMEKEEKTTGEGEKMAEIAAEKALTGAELRREILRYAEACVCSDRNLMYGEPEDNFKMIAKLWSAYLETEIDENDVANMMILFKVGRSATAERPSRDTYVDIAGYAACAGGMME